MSLTAMQQRACPAAAAAAAALAALVKHEVVHSSGPSTSSWDSSAVQQQ
jgi:hypothetical protein